MITIKYPFIFKDEIEQAKQDVIRKKREAWALANNKFKTVRGPYGQAVEVPDIESAPPAESFNINWLVIRWQTGFAVFDSNDFEKLPKKAQNKFLKLLKLGG